MHIWHIISKFPLALKRNPNLNKGIVIFIKNGKF